MMFVHRLGRRKGNIMLYSPESYMHDVFIFYMVPQALASR